MFSAITHAMCECKLGSELITTISVMCHNAIVKAGCHPARWRKISDAMLEKGKGPTIGKLITITLIEADLQFVMRMF